MPAPVAQETRKTRTMRSSSTLERRTARRAGRSCSGRPPAAARRARRRTRRARGRSWRNAPRRRPPTSRSRARAGARARGARGTRDRARRPRSRPRSARARRRPSSCREPSGASTVPSTGASVVNGYSATFGFALEIRAQQRRLARVRQADERRVGEQLQPQLAAPPLHRAGPSRRSAAPGASASRSACCRVRRLPPRAAMTRAPGVARSAISCSSLVEHLRPDRHAQLDRPRRSRRASARRGRARRCRP